MGVGCDRRRMPAESVGWNLRRCFPAAALRKHLTGVGAAAGQLATLGYLNPADALRRSLTKIVSLDPVA